MFRSVGQIVRAENFFEAPCERGRRHGKFHALSAEHIVVFRLFALVVTLRFRCAEGFIFAEQARRDNKDKRAEARLKALELRAKGADAKQVSRATGFHASSVSRLVAKYRDHGLEVISGNHYGGNHRNMSIAEEAAILAPFQERAEGRCMLIARTFKSSLLHRWSAHLWQNGMAEARSGSMNEG